MLMKRNWMILAGCLLVAINANALIVSVNGQGDIPEEGMELTLDEAEEDPLTGEMLMELDGNILSNGALTVAITRSEAGLTDEFCCAGQCTAGNGEMTEQLSFTPEGVATWFTHYAPRPNSRVTVTYLFADDDASRTLTVHYNYAAQGTEHVVSSDIKVTKILKDGIIYILQDNKKFTIL